MQNNPEIEYIVDQAVKIARDNMLLKKSKNTKFYKKCIERPQLNIIQKTHPRFQRSYNLTPRPP